MIGGRSLFVVILEQITRRQMAVAAVMLATLVGAVVALEDMPLQLLPEIRYPQVRIIGDLPGQTSSVIEESINEPLEAALTGTPGMVRMESRSGDGRAYVDLYFEPEYDLDRALRDVTQGAQRAQQQIPDEFPEPRIFAVSTMEEPVQQFAFGSQRLRAPEIRSELRTHLLPRLRAVEGVEAVYMGREEISELVVEIDPERQRALGVSLPAIEAALERATDPPPGGAMRSDSFEGIGMLGGQGWSVEGLSQWPLWGEHEAQAIELEQIAGVHRAASEESLRTRMDGDSAVLVTVYRSPQADSLEMADEINRIVEEADQSQALELLEANQLYDDSVVTRGAVQSVIVAALGGALLAMILLLIALRQRRYVFLVGAVVATSLGATVIVLAASGQSLNLLTLTGLLLSVGMGLDYAIIYLERLDRMSDEDRGPGDEALHLRAMQEVAGPLLGALMTTLAAVLPFLLVEGLVARLFEPLIWTVVVAAIFAFISAVVVLPTFARAAEEAIECSQKRSPWWGRMHRPMVAWPIVVGLVAVGVWVGKDIPFEVLPDVDDGFVDLRITHPVGIPMDQMDRITAEVGEAIKEVEGTEALFSTVGGYFREGQPSFRPATANFMARVDTAGGDRSSEAWAEDVRQAVDEIGIAELDLSVTLPRIRGVETSLSDADLIVVLTGKGGDLLALGEVENQVVELLEEQEGLVDVERLRSGVSPRWKGDFDFDAMARYGVEPATVKRVLEYGLEGRVLRQRMDGGEPLALRTRYDRRGAGGPQHLERLRVPTVHGASVELGELVAFELVEEPTHIERREDQRVVRVAAQLSPTGPGPTEVAQQVERGLDEAALGDDVSYWLEGEIEAIEETRTTFGIALGLALLLVMTLLVLQYNSMALALSGLVTIPLSGVGTLVLLSVMGKALDAMVLAGLLIAVGIIANNAILVLSEAQRGRQRGVGLQEAFEVAARDRFRPVMLTIASTVLGMSPLLWGGEEVFGLLQPLAMALTGALLLSVVVACFLLPGIAVSLLGLEERVVGRPGGDEQES